MSVVDSCGAVGTVARSCQLGLQPESRSVKFVHPFHPHVFPQATSSLDAYGEDEIYFGSVPIFFRRVPGSVVSFLPKEWRVDESGASLSTVLARAKLQVRPSLPPPPCAVLPTAIPHTRVTNRVVGLKPCRGATRAASSISRWGPVPYYYSPRSVIPFVRLFIFLTCGRAYSACRCCPRYPRV